MRLSLFGAVALGAMAAAAAPKAEPEGTLFDGIAVPPLLELTPDNFEAEMNGTKYMVVKHYSPYCHHCKDFAPLFQTLYEFYWTTPATSGEAGVFFPQEYNAKFGAINCVAFYDLCVAHGVQSYPSTTIYKNGEAATSLVGVKSIEVLSKAIEKVLEEDQPGSRPQSVAVPEAKATARPVPSAVAGAAGAKATAGKNRKAAPPGPVYKPPQKPTKTPNPDGTLVSLNAETFQAWVTTTQDPWFIKFYAPWCHHCQAMAPVWEQLAKTMQGRLNIGEVNCDKEKRLCKDAKLHGYPTILFFRGGERVEYDGLRGLGDFEQYAEKALDLSGGVQDVDLASFEALEKKGEEVLFVYFYDFATTGEDLMALDRLPLSLIGHAKLVKTKDPKLAERFKITTWPRLLVSREGRPTYYQPLTPHEMRDTHKVLQWMQSVWLPIVPELTASNAREIMDGKIVVLGILRRDNDEAFHSAIREMKSAANEWMDKQIQLFQLERQELRDAKQLRIEEAEDRNDQRALRAAKSIRVDMDRADKREVAFAWIDGVFWQRWLRTTYGIDVAAKKESASSLERVLINDEDNRRYWDQTITGNPISASRTSILETLNKITASPPKIKPKFTISSFEKVLFDMRVTASEHPLLTIGCVFGIGLGLASWFRGRLRSGRAHRGRSSTTSAFRLDDSSLRDFKMPILGGGGSEKIGKEA